MEHRVHLEHRLTDMQAQLASSTEHRARMELLLAALAKKMTLHERAMVFMFGGLQIALTDKYPIMAALLRGFMP